MKIRISDVLSLAAVGIMLCVALTTHVSGAIRETTLRSYVHKMSDVEGSCSAVMIAPGRALTAKHCTDKLAAKLTINGQDYPVTEVYPNAASDIAVLIVPGAPCPCATVGTRQMQRDQATSAVGYPFGALQIITEGVLQGRIIVEGREYLVTTARSGPGMSGGGLFNAQGELVGIISATDQHGLMTVAVELFLHWIGAK